MRLGDERADLVALGARSGDLAHGLVQGVEACGGALAAGVDDALLGAHEEGVAVGPGRHPISHIRRRVERLAPPRPPDPYIKISPALPPRPGPRAPSPSSAVPLAAPSTRVVASPAPRAPSPNPAAAPPASAPPARAGTAVPAACARRSGPVSPPRLTACRPATSAGLPVP